MSEARKVRAATDVPPAMGRMTMRGKASGGMAGMMMGSGSAMDLNDVDYDAFLANDRMLADSETVRVEARGRVRLRVINEPVLD